MQESAYTAHYPRVMNTDELHDFHAHPRWAKRRRRRKKPKYPRQKSAEELARLRAILREFDKIYGKPKIIILDGYPSEFEAA